ncbi:MAG: FAD-dependent oxidoreductase [Pseudomonadota bacterium]
MSSPKIAVIGAGIVGASIALHLVRRGGDVTVFDPGDPARAATQGSLAWINAHLSESEAYFRLRVRSLKLWKSLSTSVPGLPLRLSGSLNWEEMRGKMSAVVEDHNRLGHETHLVTREEITRIVPSIDPPDQALWCPAEGLADPDRIAWAFLSAAVAAGARLHQVLEVVRLDPDHGKVVLEDGTEITFDQTVVAAGLSSVRLLEHIGIDLPLDASPGMLLRTDPQAPLAQPFLASPQAHFWQMGDGRIIAGADYAGTHDDEAVDATAAEVLSTLQALFPGTTMIEDERRITNRPMPRDGFPILGSVPGHPKLSIAVMHSGVTLAPVVGEMMAAHLLGNGDPDLAAYSLSRFG